MRDDLQGETRPSAIGGHPQVSTESPPFEAGAVMSHSTTTLTPSNPPTELPQYGPLRILAVWAAAALPMGLLAWVVAPAIAGAGATRERFTVTLLAALTVGLVWQFALVVAIVAREQG